MSTLERCVANDFETLTFVNAAEVEVWAVAFGPSKKKSMGCVDKK
jgi:hypothetical protein